MLKRLRPLLGVMLLGIFVWTGCWKSPTENVVPSTINANGEVATDDVAPDVSVIYPGNGAVISGSVVITADAVDDIDIYCVEFFINGVKPDNGTEYNYPYECMWETNPLEHESVHTIYAKATDTSGNVSYSQTITVIVNNSEPSSEDVVLNQDLTSVQILPPNNWWNQDISNAPVDPQSNAIITWIGASRRLHPDFGVPPYGIPYVCVSNQQQLVPIEFYKYQTESDHGAPGSTAGYPVPSVAINQPNYIEGGVPGGGDYGDRHMIIYDRDNMFLYEMFGTTWNASLQQWEAACGATFDLKTNYRRPEGWTSADAAGLAIFPGLIKYDEVYGSGEITHAFRFTARASDGYVWPASHGAGGTTGAPPFGARIRLKASFDISGYPAPIQKILRAMKRYGLIFADNGSDMFIQGTMDGRWNGGMLNDAFHSIHADDFEVIELGWEPTVSGIHLKTNETDNISTGK